ncbi:MAG: histidine phosphatase family protein [Actinomycetes bacterium]
MGTTTIVHLVRHGEVHNPYGVLYGRLPGFHLSERGRAMAEATAAWLATRDIVAVVSSPLDRAQETAAPIAVVHGLAIATDDRLIEPPNVFEGQRFGVGDGALRRPASWWALRNPFEPSWSEPYTSIAARMLAAAEDLAAGARGHEAVAVSHQLPVWTARRFLEGRRLWHDPRRRECSLASVTSLTFLDSTVVSVDYHTPAGDLSPSKSRRFVAGA